MIRPWLPKLQEALLARISRADPAALEAAIGATASALESMLWYAPGRALPRFSWRFGADGTPGLELEGQPLDGGEDDTPEPAS